ncbi:MAG: DNA polymerase III subunit alpha [Acidobacteria bacterium]|nr:DNA polymerase III subunit alpha [Acidobacteriota bacterium]
MYVELHTASAFSFLQAASSPEALVARAAELGYPALALLDRDGVYGAPRFHKAARAAGLRPLIGAELTMQAAAGHHWVLPVLVESVQGWRHLCQLISRMKLRAAKGHGALTLADLDGQVGGLVALVGDPLLQVGRDGVGGLLDRLIGTFGRTQLYVELQRHLQRDQEDANAMLVSLAEAFRVPLVATGGVRYATAAERPLCDVLTCIRAHTTLEAAGRRLAPNAERLLKAPAQMARLFADRPDAVQATLALADRLQFSMHDLGYRFPRYPVPHGDTEHGFLCQMVDVGARHRYQPYHDRARAQIARELHLIDTLNLAGYFLIVWDIVNFCRQNDILVQGRGSAANSAVCYSLGITAVDPVGMELLFERFLSEERGEWPDIDLDLPSGLRRERVIQYVYEKYGPHGAAMTANVITYRGRSAAREVGKVLGMAPADIDRLSAVLAHADTEGTADHRARHLAAQGYLGDAAQLQQFAALWPQMLNVPRHLGQHSGGMVISQGALSSVVPLEPASMPGRVVVQWDKEDCADMGIIKVDLLGLGMMAALQEAIRLINGPGRQPPRIDLAHLPPNDPAVYAMLQAADTVGIFQVESRAQMATLPRLKPATFYDLVVEIALIRPGPIVGQMVHPYLNRRAGREPVTYDHPLLEPILRRTLGVPLFQEQLLRMAMAVAGFTGGQAEELRRAMGFKRSEQRMQQMERLLRDGMARHGITGEVADRIVLSITSFALYGFPESHAASFALLVYASAYLKAHYPAAFYTALLNNQPMGFYHPSTLVKDAQRRGVRFAPIDVQVSQWPCQVEPDGTIRLGLSYVQGLRAEAGQAITRVSAHTRSPATPGGSPASHTACPKCGCDDASMLEGGFCNVCSHQWSVSVPVPQRFRSIDELVRMAGLRHDEVEALAAIGALNSLGGDRRSALWQAAQAVRPSGELFTDTEEGIVEHEPAPLAPMTDLDRLVADYDGTSLTLGAHPMRWHREALAMRGVMRATDLQQARPGRRVRTAGMVITRQRPVTAKGFVFLTLEDETGLANVIIRPALYDTSQQVAMTASCLLVEGVLQQQEGVTSVRAERLVALDHQAVPVDITARNFH